MSQILQGQYYEAGREGYINRGKQTIKFSAKVNHLPVYSRCNKLLKCQQHHLEFGNRRKLQQVYCYQSPQPVSRNSLQKNNNISYSNTTLVHRPNTPKIYNCQNKTKQINKKQNSIQESHNPEQKQQKSQRHNKNQISHSLKQLHTKSNFSPQYEKKPEQDNTRRLKIVQHINNPLKQSISPLGYNENIQQPRNESNDQKQYAKLYSGKEEQKAQQQDQNYQCVTQQTVYDPHAQLRAPNIYKLANRKINPNSHNSHYYGYKNTNNSNNMNDKSTNIRHGQQKILDQLTRMLEKVGRLEQKIHSSDQEYRIKYLENQITRHDMEIDQLNKQNYRLRAQGVSQSRYMCKSHNHQYYQNKCCNCKCVGGANKGEGLHLVYFIIFMLGVLFTKAALC